MLTSTEKKFSLIFFLIVIAELICGSVEKLSHFHYVTKPTIVISLMLFFWKEATSISGPIRSLTLLALTFSLLGDVLLMFVNISPHYFMFGLVAFLLAHVFYIQVFLKHRNPEKNHMVIWVILLMYGTVLFSILRNSLGEMLIPVLIYMLVILIMATAAILRKEKVPSLSYKTVCFGAILFLISDSLLAINKFYAPFAFANILIMLTYALAQYFIVLGIKKQS